MQLPVSLKRTSNIAKATVRACRSVTRQILVKKPEEHLNCDQPRYTCEHQCDGRKQSEGAFQPPVRNRICGRPQIARTINNQPRILATNVIVPMTPRLNAICAAPEFPFAPFGSSGNCKLFYLPCLIGCSDRDPCAAATPSTRLDVERTPSLAPRTAARSQPTRSVRCVSLCPAGIFEPSSIKNLWKPRNALFVRTR